MGSLSRILMVLTTVFFLLLTAETNPVPINPNPGPDAPLPAPQNIQSEVNVNEVVTVALPSRLLQRPNTGGQYSIRYSVNAIQSTSNDYLMAIPVSAVDLRAALQAAINDGTKHSPSEMQTSFQSTANGLSVIMNSYEPKSNRPPFNWQDVSSIASVLLKASPGGVSTANCFVGVVINPEGKSIVDIAVLPSLIHIQRKALRSVAALDSSTSHPRHNVDTPSRLQKRVLYPVRGTVLTLDYETGAHSITGVALRMLIDYALDLVVLDVPGRAYYRILSSPLGPILAGEGHVIFSLRAVNSQPIAQSDVVAILTAIRAVVTTYTQWNRFPGTPYRSVVGRVSNNAGVVIAHWSVGEPMGSAGECGTVVVLQPDGSHGLGCLAS